MAATATGYQQMPAEEEEEESTMKKFGKKCGKVTGIFCLILILIVVVVQLACYKFATMKCNARTLEGYEFPGGGASDLVPGHSLLIEQEPRWWGSSFIVSPADRVGLASGASVGVYFRTWGPIFWTYVYQDDLGMQTFMIRDRPLAFGGSHQIARCDGKGPVYIVSEGSHYVMNSIRSMFGMYTSRVYNIWEGKNLVAVSEKLGGTGQSHKQIIFRDPAKATPFASSFLQHRDYHGSFDEWSVQDEDVTPLPAFVPNAITALMAFPTAAAKAKAAKAASNPAAFMAELETQGDSALAAEASVDQKDAVEGAGAQEEVAVEAPAVAAAEPEALAAETPEAPAAPVEEASSVALATEDQSLPEQHL